MSPLEDIDATNWSELEPQYRGFLEREIGSAEELEKWLIELGEFDAYVSETGAMLYVNMTCDTEDEDIKKAYFDFVDKIQPELAIIGDLLNRKLVDCPYSDELDDIEYKVLLRDTRMDLQLFREENIPLSTELTKLGVRHKEISAAMTVDFDGEERTMQQMGKYLQVNERNTRESAYKAVGKRRFEDAEEMDEIYEEMIKLRHKIALNAGYSNYRDYIFDAKHRFDYTPADCESFHDAVESICVPLMRDIDEERRKILDLDSLRMWDLGHDVRGRAPLKPFEKVEEMVAGTSRMFHRLSPELGSFFDSLRDGTSLDLDSRKGKAPGGYQLQRDHSRKPFIFMNAVGLQRDVETLLHEAGHAFHTLAAQGEDIHEYQHAPLEFCEVASMSMELVGNEHLEEFYSSEDCVRARRQHLEGIISLFPWIATVDAFQHWIYTHPTHTVEERDAAWNGLLDRFGGDIDWSGYELARTKMWHRQSHIFLVPFYYIEYGIAQLGALGVWKNSKSDRAQALADYKRALALGGSRPLPELFAAANIPFRFDTEAFKPLVELVQAELSALK